MLSAALARHLDALDLVTFDAAGADCFLEDLPGDPADAVGIFAQAGPRAVLLRRPVVQVLVRADPNSATGRARTGFERAQAILDALDHTGHVTWGEGSPDAVRIAWCLAQQSSPVDIGTDDNGAPRWSVRFDVEVAGEVGR